MSVEFHIDSGEVFTRLRLAQAKGPQVLGRALYKLANEIMTDSKQHYVPYEIPGQGQSGELRASGNVEPPKVESDGAVSVRMSYGGPAAAYALAVHEHLSEHSPYSWQRAEELGHPVQWSHAGTGPKYLERPLMEHTGVMLERGAEALKDLFGSNFIEAPSELMGPEETGWVG